MPELKSPPVQFRYEDRPELLETFSDSVGHWHFDGSTLRVDFLITRFDPIKSPEPRSGRRLPVCRLALTTAGAIELLNECRRITVALEKAGLVKQEQGEKAPAQPN
jgi:hypothetical protein